MSNQLVKSATIIMAVTLVGRLLGLVRDSLIASTYGLSWQLDVYNWLAMILLILYMVVPGALNAVYIPVMSKYVARAGQKMGDLTEGLKKGRNQLFQRVWTVVLLAFFLLSLLLYLLAPQIVAFLLPGVSGEEFALTVQLFRVMLPAVFIMGLIGLLMSVSYSEERFLLPSIGTVILSVTVLASVYLLVPAYGIYGLTVGTVASYFIFALLLVVATWRKGYPLTLRFDLWSDTDLKRMGELFFPILLGMVIAQAYFFINQGLASTLDEGAQSALVLAQKLYQLPPAIFVGAFTVPLLPILSDLVKQNKISETKLILRQGMSYLHILLIPTMVAFMVMGDTFIQLIFEYREFTAEDTQRTYWALLFFSLALVPMAIRDMLTRTFYALEDTKTPVMIGIFSIMLNFGLALLFMEWLAHGAMALAYSLAILFDMLFLILLLKRKIGSIFDTSYLLSLGKVSLAALVMGLGLGVLKHYLASQVSVYFLTPLLVGSGAGTYYLLLHLLREERVAELRKLVINKTFLG